MREPSLIRQSSLIRRENLEFEVLSLLEIEPGISQRELARRLGASLGRINSCVNVMLENDRVKRITRPLLKAGLRNVYELTVSGISRRSALANDYLQRKRAELERLTAQIASFQRIVPSETPDENP